MSSCGCDTHRRSRTLLNLRLQRKEEAGNGRNLLTLFLPKMNMILPVSSAVSNYLFNCGNGFMVLVANDGYWSVLVLFQATAFVLQFLALTTILSIYLVSYEDTSGARNVKTASDRFGWHYQLVIDSRDVDLFTCSRDVDLLMCSRDVDLLTCSRDVDLFTCSWDVDLFTGPRGSDWYVGRVVVTARDRFVGLLRSTSCWSEE